VNPPVQPVDGFDRLAKRSRKEPMMTTADLAAAQPAVLLSGLLKHAVLDANGQDLGQVVDAIVTLRGADYPLLTGLLVRIGSVNVFVPVERVGGIDTERIEVLDAKPDLHPPARRTGDVLLSGELLGHRLIDVSRAVLVRAYDAQLTHDEHGWVLTGLDVHKRRFLHHVLGRHDRHTMRDWHTFEPLIGHEPSLSLRSEFGKLAGLKPAQLADLVEAASAEEQQELLAHVHTNRELEADVFEELDDDEQTQLLRARPIEAIVEVIARMRADDATDALMDLPQDKRLPVLERLPEPQRTKVRTLLGYNDATAGGLMGMDYIAGSDDDTVDHVLGLVRASTSQQPEALTVLFSLDEHGRLTGSISLVRALQVPGYSRLREVTDRSPIHAHPHDDIVDVARQMNDFNLLVLPVIAEDDGRILGVITVDDALEATMPRDWKRREPHRHAAIPATPDTAGR